MVSTKVVKYPQGFTCVDNRVLKSQNFRSSKPMTRLVYLYVAQYRNNDTGIAFPSHETIATDMGVSESSVKRAINELVKLQLLDKIRTKGVRHNTYVFRFDGVDYNRTVEPEFEYPAEPDAIVEVEPEPPLKLVTRQDPHSRVDLPTVDACRGRASQGYSTLEGAKLALAVWYDHYAITTGFVPTIMSWPASMAHAKRLFKFFNGDTKRLIQWVKAAFECATAKEICFKDGPGGLIITGLMNDYNAQKINAWIKQPKGVWRDPDDFKRPTLAARL